MQSAILMEAQSLSNLDISMDARSAAMNLIADKLAAKAALWSQETQQLVAEGGSMAIGHVNVAQIFGGMRGVNALVCDTSEVDAENGLIIRGYPVSELAGCLPEEIFWLLLLGEMPSTDELTSLQSELSARAELPQQALQVVNSMPADSHPMAMLSAGILSMQNESRFANAYDSTGKADLWRPALEDALDLLARMNVLAAHVYRIRYQCEEFETEPGLDLAANYAHMLGMDSPEAQAMMRLFLILHSDHENGNVSAHSALITGSTHADPYYAISSAMNGLAGPIHGLASQKSVEFAVQMLARIGMNASDDAVHDYVKAYLDSGKRLPGYGHAVLRELDPRFVLLLEFGEKHFADDAVFSAIKKIYGVTPNLLKEMGKVRNPYPNVDGITGAVLNHYGITQPEYYTVVFGVGLSIGMLAQYVLNRALGMPIVRPKSVNRAKLHSALN